MNASWALTAAVFALGLSLSHAATPDGGSENCSGDARLLWADGQPVLMRACGGWSILIEAQPLSVTPLAYLVAVKNGSDQAADIDRDLFMLMDKPTLDPARISARMRRRAGWAAGFAGMSESFGHASSSEIAAAEGRASGPLRQSANAVEVQALKRNTLLPSSFVVGVLYFERVKKISEGTLRFASPSGQVLEFHVFVDRKKSRF